MNKKKKKKNFCLSYRETRPTRSIDVDLTFIVDEQRSSIKNVLETNNNSSSGYSKRNGKNEDLRLRINRIDSTSIHAIHICYFDIWKKF